MRARGLLAFITTGAVTVSSLLPVLPYRHALSEPPLSSLTRTARLTALATSLQSQFPAVPVITIEQLTALLASHSHQVLLDVREASEYNVSHISGAQRLSLPVAEKDSLLLGLPHDSLIVVYCSVGYRSALAAQSLQELGFKNTRNLIGGIFLWASNGLPLISGPVPLGGPKTKSVHPYNLFWGSFVHKTLHRLAP